MKIEKNIYYKKTARLLSYIIIPLAALASGAGILYTKLYRDNSFIKAAWLGNDIATLFIAVPLLILSVILLKRKSIRGHLLWSGSLGYMIYNYIFYLYGAAFNILFLVYVLIVVLSLYALILSLMSLDVEETASSFHEKTPVRFISSYMIFFASILFLLWTAMSVGFIITGKVPQAIIQTGHPTGVVFAADLTILVPAVFLGGILLWRRKPWGFILSAVVLTKACTYSIALLIMGYTAWRKTGLKDDFMPLWIILSMGAFLSIYLLLENIEHKEIIN